MFAESLSRVSKEKKDDPDPLGGCPVLDIATRGGPLPGLGNGEGWGQRPAFMMTTNRMDYLEIGAWERHSRGGLTKTRQRPEAMRLATTEPTAGEARCSPSNVGPTEGAVRSLI